MHQFLFNYIVNVSRRESCENFVGNTTVGGCCNDACHEFVFANYRFRLIDTSVIILNCFCCSDGYRSETIRKVIIAMRWMPGFCCQNIARDMKRASVTHADFQHNMRWSALLHDARRALLLQSIIQKNCISTQFASNCICCNDERREIGITDWCADHSCQSMTRRPTKLWFWIVMIGHYV